MLIVRRIGRFYTRDALCVSSIKTANVVFTGSGLSVIAGKLPIITNYAF
jgi:hypothetical protein